MDSDIAGAMDDYTDGASVDDSIDRFIQSNQRLANARQKQDCQSQKEKQE